LYIIAEWPRGVGLVVCYLTGLQSHVWNLDASQFLLDFSFITSGSHLVMVLAARFFVANLFIKKTIMSNIPFFPIEYRKRNSKKSSYFYTFSKLFKQVARTKKNFNKCILSYLVYSQTWLNFLVDGCQCGHSTKLRKKNTEIRLVNPQATRVNQEHPPVHHGGWMVSGDETVFC